MDFYQMARYTDKSLVPQTLRYLSRLPQNVQENVDNFVMDTMSDGYEYFSSREQIEYFFFENNQYFLSNLNYDDRLTLKQYSGYNFKNINAVLRHNWNYDVNGNISEAPRYEKEAEEISRIISAYPNPPRNFMAYRGTNIDAFKQYGVENVRDLLKLKGNYLYEPAFTSTSLTEDTCYYQKKLDTGINYNVEIKYIISSETQEGIAIYNNELSYSPNQLEYIINSSSTSKIVHVEIDERNNTAVLYAVLIPRKMLTETYNYSPNVKK